MPRRRGQGAMEISAEINVTSLVDVVLTLLVIFMITAPMLQGGVEVSVPRARTESVPSSDGIVVTVDRQSVYLRADQGVPYGRVVQVLGAMKAADVATVGLIAEEENPGGGR